MCQPQEWTGKCRFESCDIPDTCSALVYCVTALTIAQVDPSELPCLAQWKREYTMETVLIELRRYANFDHIVLSGC